MNACKEDIDMNSATATTSAADAHGTTEASLFPTISKKSILSSRKKSWFFLLGKKSVTFAEMESEPKSGERTKTHERWRMYVAEQFKTLNKRRETRARWLGRAGRKSRRKRCSLNNNSAGQSSSSSSSSEGATIISGDKGLAHNASSDLLENFEIPEPDHKKRKKEHPKSKRKKRSPQTDRNRNRKRINARRSSRPTSADVDSSATKETTEDRKLKRPPNSFLIFSRCCRLELKDLMLPPFDNRLVTMVLGHIWRYLSKDERRCFYEEAEQQRNYYYEQKNNLQLSKPKDQLDTPKKPLNAFMIFCQEQRLQPKTTALSGSQAVKKIAKKWRKMSPSQKKVYIEKAASEGTLCETNAKSSNNQEDHALIKEANSSGVSDEKAVPSLGAILLQKKMGKNNNKWLTDSSDDSATLIKVPPPLNPADLGSGGQRVANVSLPSTSVTRDALVPSMTSQGSQVLATVRELCPAGSESDDQCLPSISRCLEVPVSACASLSIQSASDISRDSDEEGSERRRQWRRKRRRRKRRKRKRGRVRRKGQCEDEEEKEEEGRRGILRTPRSSSKQVRWKDEFYPWDTFNPVSSVLQDDADLCSRICSNSRLTSAAPLASKNARKCPVCQANDPCDQPAGSRGVRWLQTSRSLDDYCRPCSVADPGAATSQESSLLDRCYGLKSPVFRDDYCRSASSTSVDGYKRPPTTENRYCQYSSSCDDCFMRSSKTRRSDSRLSSSAARRSLSDGRFPCTCSSSSNQRLLHDSGHRVSSLVAAGRASGRAQVEAVFLKPSVELSHCSTSASSSDCPYTLPDVMCSSSSNEESPCVSHRFSNFNISSHQGSSCSAAATSSSASNHTSCCQRPCEANSSYSARPTHLLTSHPGRRCGNIESNVHPTAPRPGDLRDSGVNTPTLHCSSTFSPQLTGLDRTESRMKPKQYSIPVSEIHGEEQSAASSRNSRHWMKPSGIYPKHDAMKTRSSGEVSGVLKIKTRSAEDLVQDNSSTSAQNIAACRFPNEHTSTKASSENALNPPAVITKQSSSGGRSEGRVCETLAPPISTEFKFLCDPLQKDRQLSKTPVRHTSQEAIAQLVRRIKREEDLDRCLIPRAVSLEMKGSHSFRPSHALIPDDIREVLSSFAFSNRHENSPFFSAVGSASIESADKFVELYGTESKLGDGHSTSSSVQSNEQSGISDKTRSLSEDREHINRQDQRSLLKRKCSYDSLEVVNSSNNFSVSTAPGCSSLKYAFDLDRSCSRGASFRSDSASDLGKLCSRRASLPSDCAFGLDKSCSGEFDLNISCSRAFDLNKSYGRRETLPNARLESGLGDDLINFQTSEHPKSVINIPMLSDLEVEFCQQKGWIH